MATAIKLTEWTSCGGCAAKWGASPLDDLIRRLAAGPDGETAGALHGDAQRLLVGLAPFDDAAVWRLGDDLALVSTTDFFPPLVDDPEDFGAVAAANACSDVFAMGGRVVLALNVAAFPERFPSDAVAAILTAAARVVTEAGGVVAGGHTIRSEEPIFGLAVQGLVHPDRVWTKGAARTGDVVVLSKPIGTGVILAGGDDAQKATAIKGMRTLNRAAAEALAGTVGVHAVTDVTGFGLLGHAWEVADRSGVTVSLDSSAVPLYPGALEAAEQGVRTGGDTRNRAHLSHPGRVDIAPDVSEAMSALAFDPQTSGGLLATVTPDAADALSQRAGVAFRPVGRVVDGPPVVRLTG